MIVPDDHVILARKLVESSGVGGGLTQKLDGQPLEGGIPGGAGASFPRRLGSGVPSQIQNLEVAKALARQLAPHVDLFPSLEAVGRGPVAMEFAVRVGQGGHEMGLNHCTSGVRGIDGVLVESQRGGYLG